MKLHLGCGKRNFEGWTNVDLLDASHIHYNTSVDKLGMIESETVDVIYSSHTLEYFDRFDAIDVLNEWRRVLKSGGTLRLSVPDFQALLKVYKDSKDITKILGPLYGRMSVETLSGSQLLYHKTVYDFMLLKEILESVGFIKIKKYDWRLTDHSAYDDHSQAYYPHMDKENGLLISLNVEAFKC